MPGQPNDKPHARLPQVPPNADAELRSLHDQAERCRRLAGATYDRATSDALTDMANGFDASADRLAYKG